MQAKYFVEITDPHKHYVHVRLELERQDNDKIRFFMPSWSPGSYLMREYARHVRKLKVQAKSGRALYFEKKEKGIWEIDFNHESLGTDESEFSISYEVYCHELTVRTSHIDISHAFLHGPSYLMGSNDIGLGAPQIEFKFPQLWNKLTTGLKDISSKREVFLYEAKSYDDLLDCPVEIGNQVTDGFVVKEKPHHLAFYGETYPHGKDLKGDIQKIVEYIADVMGDELPYDQYIFMTHFKAGLFGGLEHSNSTALQFDGRKLLKKETYLQWLCLVSHEYFHTWNVKRIRPIELGPFDYTNENYSQMLWLVEGLTSFVDELFVYQAGLCSLEEYLVMQKNNFARYYQTPGRRFDSLESSSFDAWVKLYRPDENSRNSTVSYYLKGGLVFSVLSLFFHEKEQSFQLFLKDLWDGYKKQPEVGFTKEDVLRMIEGRIGKELTSEFESMLSTTQDIDFEKYYNRVGMSFVWKQDESPYLGVVTAEESGKLIVKSVELDTAAHRYGLNAGDEIIAINEIRVGAEELNALGQYFVNDQKYLFTIARLGKLMELPVVLSPKGKTLEAINVSDKNKAEKALRF